MRSLAGVRSFVIVWGVLASVAIVSAQGRRQSGAVQVPVVVNLKVGAETIQATGSGSCTHAPQAAIFSVKSHMRTARIGEGERSVQLTWWDPADGSDDMINLSVGTGSSSRNVSTVRGGQPSGSGTATFEAEGKRGTFRVQAKAADGTAIAGTITCEAFTPHVAEGG